VPFTLDVVETLQTARLDLQILEFMDMILQGFVSEMSRVRPDRSDHGYELRHRCHEHILTYNDDKRIFVYRQLHEYSC